MPLRESQGAYRKVAHGIARLVEGWALAGGILLFGVVLVTAWSMGGNILFNQPVPGDFEIVEVAVAVAVFAFLPYCQLTGANVSADIFTAGASPRWIAGFSALAALVALVFAAVLFWRMSLGLQDYREYEELTMVYQFPLWVAFVPILVSLALLVLAALVTLVDACQGQPQRTARDQADRGGGA
ncbi:MAG: TRAP transporter small permease subunit [Sneathiellaceae bacterium]